MNILIRNNYRGTTYIGSLIFVFLLLVLAMIEEVGADIKRNLDNTHADNPTVILSPDKQIRVLIENNKGKINYTISYKNKVLIAKSRLGYKLAKPTSMLTDFVVENKLFRTEHSNWENDIGENGVVQNNYNEVTLALKQSKTEQKLHITFRVFNDGVGFRYTLPEQKGVTDIAVVDEITQFNVVGNPQLWVLPVDYDSYEKIYEHSTLEKFTSSQTPLTFRYDSGIHLSIHEAALVDYPSMTVVRSGSSLEADLVPWPDGIKVKQKKSMLSPWRTIQISNDASGLLESALILNLNEPNKIKDTSWIKPQKYLGIWWAMHLGINTWHPGDKHGATTENAKQLIDFAASNGFGGILVEGWNEGWDKWANWSFTKAYPDFDLAEVVKYGKSKQIDLIAHNETAGYVEEYSKQMHTAYKLYNSLEIPMIKVGYVGPIKNGQHHQGQWMVNHIQTMVETAAANKISIIGHEVIKDTGLRRTWPNFLSRESARGQEYNAPWSAVGNMPDHTTILAFTRMLAGPMDFTPGIFDLTYKRYGEYKNRVSTTLAKQLALYVVIYSPVQMASDMPASYRDQPAFEFIKGVAVNWEKTKVINGQIGDYITVARKEREGKRWFIGSITDEHARTLEVSLDFLDDNVTYQATLYKDGKGAHWKSNPEKIDIVTAYANKHDLFVIHLAPGGGQAIVFEPVKSEK